MSLLDLVTSFDISSIKDKSRLTQTLLGLLEPTYDHYGSANTRIVIFYAVVYYIILYYAV